MPRRTLAAAALAAALALGCRTPEQRLLDARRDLRATLDDLYADYREAAAPEGGEDPGLLGRLVGEVDRSWFEQQCLALGRGERPVGASARAEAFLHERGNARACRKAADLQLEIEKLERETEGAAERRDPARR